MGRIRQPVPVKLFVGILSSIPQLVPQVEKRLMEAFGPIELRSPPYPFELTQYYSEEMGSPVQRWFIGFSNLIKPDQIAAIKVQTNRMESEIAAMCCQVPRPVNLDPGYMELAKIILVSTKNFYHRILIGEGIYGEVTRHFEGGEWRSLPWTFPDFKTGRYDKFFSALRKIYRSQLRARRPDHRSEEVVH
jgi:hypothetical protein